jgi:hypothetical protein
MERDALDAVQVPVLAGKGVKERHPALRGGVPFVQAADIGANVDLVGDLGMDDDACWRGASSSRWLT